MHVSRGQLVNERDLVKALDSVRIGGAPLDVYELEPISRYLPMLGRSNVVPGCHNANDSAQALELVHLEARLGIQKVPSTNLKI